MKTIIHEYEFDMHKPDQANAYQALVEKLTLSGLKVFESHGGGSHFHGMELDGRAIELETEHLFKDQWNTAPVDGYSDNGLRVFDWAQDYLPNRFLKRGHWLEQTAEMAEIRRNRYSCGYCGHQEEAQRGKVFCDCCLDSEYLERKDLFLLRMKSIAGKGNRKPLTEAETAHLLPLYLDAQMHGSTERGKARITQEIKGIHEEFHSVTENALAKRDGFLWLIGHGIKTDNVIYYSHTKIFCFGWRKPIDKDLKDMLLEIISEFPFAYEISCQDGEKLTAI